MGFDREQAMRRKKRSIEQTIKHPIRRKWIEALWHSSEPLSPQRFRSEYLDGNAASLSTLAYHVGVLDTEGIAKLDRADNIGDGATEHFYVLGGPNSAEAVSRLQLTAA